MIKAIIIEDELYPRKVLLKMLDKHCPQIAIVASCANAEEGLEAIRLHDPDLLFLDINMPGMNGIEMLRQMDEIDFDIIFTTAHDEFALEAFKVSPVDYLLKPVDETELIAAVERFVKRTARAINKEQLELLITRLQPHHHFQKLAVPSHETLEFVEIEDIVRCEADRNYTMIITRQGKQYVYSRPLKDVEKLLPSELFLRVHQSHLINIRDIQTYVRGIGGQLVLKDGKIIPVARTRKESLMKRLFDV